MCKEEMNDVVQYYDNIYLAKPDKWNEAKRDMFAYEQLRELVSHPVNMLDYGCGNGHTLEFFSSMWTTGKFTGIDISEVALRLCRWNMPDGKFYTSLPDGEWNLITIMGVAEHFEDPSESLRLIGKRLSPGGFMYLEVPDCLAYSDTQDEGFRMTYDRADQDEWHLTRESWENIIRDAGLRIAQRIQGEHAAWEFIWILQRDERE